MVECYFKTGLDDRDFDWCRLTNGEACGEEKCSIYQTLNLLKTIMENESYQPNVRAVKKLEREEFERRCCRNRVCPKCGDVLNVNDLDGVSGIWLEYICKCGYNHKPF